MLQQNDPYQEYFDAVQKFILDNNTENLSESDIDIKIKSLEEDNLQAVINQDFNDSVSVEDCASKVIEMLNTNTASSEDVINKAPDQLDGDRGLNTMERKIMNFNEFLNEKVNEAMSTNELFQNMLEYKYPDSDVDKFFVENKLDFSKFTWTQMKNFFEEWLEKKGMLSVAKITEKKLDKKDKINGKNKRKYRTIR